MKKKNVLLNLIVSLSSQVITLIFGLVLPRLILLAWGSEYNGLLSSVTNIFRYLTLLEVGFNTATLQALYKSIGQNDIEQTSIIVRTSQMYYHRVSVVYASIVCIIAFGYPLIIYSEIPFWDIVAIILLQGAVGVINFSFRASYQQLLNAEGKYYIISLITLLSNLLTYAAKIAAIHVFHSVIIMQLFSVIVIIIQITIYTVYFNRHYKWLNKNVKPDKSILQNRKYYFIQQIAGLVFNSTDTFVLSVFCGLKVASVYAVYNLVYSALQQMISLIRSSTNFVLGQTFHQDKNRFRMIYDAYSAMQSMIGGIMASISILLIISFIRLYTRNVTDIDYIDYIVAFLFSFNLMLECSRGTSLASANIAGKAPETTWRYILEAGINLGTSLILVNIIGIRGVLIGTSLAGIYRTTDSIIYTNRKVLERSPAKEIGVVGFDFLLYFGIAFLSYYVIKINAGSYVDLCGAGIIAGICVILVYGSVFFITNRKNANLFIQVLRKRV